MVVLVAAPLAAALFCLTVLFIKGSASPTDPLMVMTFFACNAAWFAFLAVMLEWVARQIEARTPALVVRAGTERAGSTRPISFPRRPAA